MLIRFLLFFVITLNRANNENLSMIATDVKVDEPYSLVAASPQIQSDTVVKKYKSLLNQQKYDEALKYIKNAAKGDNPEYLYLYGYHITYYSNLDYVLSAQLFEKAAKLGHKTAALSLATSYFEGLGVISDSNKALSILIEAANSGNFGAMEQLMAHYWLGWKIPKSIKDAMKWANLLAYNKNYSSNDAIYVDKARDFLKYRYLQGTEVQADTNAAYVMMILLNEHLDDFARTDQINEFKFIESRILPTKMDSLIKEAESINGKALNRFKFRFEIPDIFKKK